MHCGGDLSRPWGGLPVELVQEVLLHLKGTDHALLRQVNQHWCAAVSSCVTTMHLDLAWSQQQWQAAAERLIHAFPESLQLVLHGGPDAKDAPAKLALLRRCWPSLRSLDVTGGAPLVTWQGLCSWQSLLRPQSAPPGPTPPICQLSGLVSLKLDCCLGFPRPRALAGLSLLQALQELELCCSEPPAVSWCDLVSGGGCVALNDRHLQAIASSCSQLQALRLDHLTDASEQSLTHLASCRGLTELRLSGPWGQGVCLVRVAALLNSHQLEQQEALVVVQGQQLVLSVPGTAAAAAVPAAGCRPPATASSAQGVCSRSSSACVLPPVFYHCGDDAAHPSSRSSMDSSLSQATACWPSSSRSSCPSRSSLESIGSPPVVLHGEYLQQQLGTTALQDSAPGGGGDGAPCIRPDCFGSSSSGNGAHPGHHASRGCSRTYLLPTAAEAAAAPLNGRSSIDSSGSCCVTDAVAAQLSLGSG